ncbi:MAG: hypothetical protein NXI31_13505 [bacterium]|nr:hypothetical protein [bacterium]
MTKEKEEPLAPLSIDLLEQVEHSFCNCGERVAMWGGEPVGEPQRPFGRLLERIRRKVRGDTRQRLHDALARALPGDDDKRSVHGVYDGFTKLLRGEATGDKVEYCADVLWLLLLGEDFANSRRKNGDRVAELAKRIHWFFVRGTYAQPELGFFHADRYESDEPWDFYERLAALRQLMYRAEEGCARFVQVCSMSGFLQRRDSNETQLLHRVVSECATRGVDVVLVVPDPSLAPLESAAYRSARELEGQVPGLRVEPVVPSHKVGPRSGYEYFSSPHRFSLLEFVDPDKQASFRHMVVRAPGSIDRTLCPALSKAEVDRFHDWIEAFVPQRGSRGEQGDAAAGGG